MSQTSVNLAFTHTKQRGTDVLDRLHEEVSGQRVVRTTFREYLSDWLMAKKAETASSTMDFYQTSLRKFLQFLGQRPDEPIDEITKQDVVAFRHSLVGQVSAKTVNHDLKALKMLFKSARRGSAITDDPTEFVEAVRKERVIKIKRPFTLRRLGDIATLRWNNLDVARGELGLSTQKTGKAIVLPLAASLRKQIECLLTSSNEPSAPVHPTAFDLVERQRKTGNLSNQFAGLLAAAGLRQKKNHKSTGKGRGKRRNVEPLSFHSLRRTATTLLHEAGVPSAVAQALIGHDNEAMHELYISIGREALEKATAALPEI